MGIISNAQKLNNPGSGSKPTTKPKKPPDPLGNVKYSPGQHYNNQENSGAGRQGGVTPPKPRKSGQVQASEDIRDLEKGMYGGVSDVMSDVHGKQTFDEERYLGATGDITDKYSGKLQNLADQSIEQGKDAQSVYSNTILPNQQTLLEGAMSDVADRMTLGEFSDPNNAVQQSVRDMYQKQAQDVGRQGLADVGILQSLGAQALGQEIGGGMPISGGQMQALQAGYGAQAGQAMARVQRQMQNLRDQGIDRGFDFSRDVYNAGVDAEGRAAGLNQQLQGLQGANLQQQQGLRNERQGIYGNIMGADMGQQDRILGVNQAQTGREGQIGMTDVYGQYAPDISHQTRMYGREGDIAARNAARDAQPGFFQSIAPAAIGALGYMGGAALGGPLGGAAGAAAGNAVGQGLGLTGGQQPQPSSGGQYGGTTAPYNFQGAPSMNLPPVGAPYKPYGQQGYYGK